MIASTFKISFENATLINSKLTKKLSPPGKVDLNSIWLLFLVPFVHKAAKVSTFICMYTSPTLKCSGSSVPDEKRFKSTKSVKCYFYLTQIFQFIDPVNVRFSFFTMIIWSRQLEGFSTCSFKSEPFEISAY